MLMPRPRRETSPPWYLIQHVSDLSRGHPTQHAYCSPTRTHPHSPSPNGQPSQITLIMMTTIIIMPAESAYRLFQAETTYRHRNQPGDGGWGDGIARHDVVSLSLFFFSSPFPLRVRRQTASGREWVGSSCGDGALTGAGMEGADALMQVSWIVKGPPVGSTDSHLPTYFFFPAVFFLAQSRRWSGRLPSVSLRPSHPPLTLPPTLYPTGP